MSFEEKLPKPFKSPLFPLGNTSVPGIFGDYPNILGRLNYIASNNVQAVGHGALYYPMENGTKTETTNNNPLNYPVEIAIDASRSSSLYVNDLSEVRVNALFSMMLIRSY